MSSMNAEDLQKQFAYVQNEKYQRLSKIKKQKQETLQVIYTLINIYLPRIDQI